MTTDVPNKFPISYPYAVHEFVQAPQVQTYFLDEVSSFVSSSIHYFNSGQIQVSDFSIANLRQTVYETLSEYFRFDSQLETVAFISENTWIMTGLINCHHFLTSNYSKISEISLEFLSDLGTLYLKVSVSDYIYAEVAELRGKFFEFILPQSRLFKAINIALEPDEV